MTTNSTPASAPNQYFIFDIETGGLDPDLSLLTLYGMILDENLRVIESIDLKIHPDNGIYKVWADPGRGLAVNKINLINHASSAIPKQLASTEFREFVCRHTGVRGLLGPAPRPLTIVGHNVRMDVEFTKRNLLPEWDQYFSRRHIDTASVAQFLQITGKLPKDIVCSLSELVTHFKLAVDQNTMHDAKVDTELTLAVFKRMIDLATSK